jgi:preprotein translocase subunit SecF
MSRWRDISHGRTHVDFVGRRRIWFGVAAGLMAISIISLVTRGLDLSLDFTGGLSASGPNPAGATVADLRSSLAPLGVADAQIQLLGEGEAFLVEAGVLPLETQSDMLDALAATAGTDRASISVESVGPSFGSLVAQKALIALASFLAVAAIWITIRLGEWKMAGAALVALLHDVLLTAGIYSLTGFQVSPATVVAFLTILGYSMYDTVVVFDKVSELADERGSRDTYSNIVNAAANQVLFRSLMTSLTSLLPVGAILFIGSFILGAASLQDFALALFVGIGAGTYSSLFVAAPLLAVWKESEDEWASRRRKLESKSTEAKVPTAPASVPAMEPVAPTTASRAAEGTVQPPSPTRPPGSGAQPRPPKKKRR